MNHSGSYSLSDLNEDVIVVRCPRCSYRERYNAARVQAVYGDLPLPSLLTIISKTECTGRDGWGGCGLVYERPPARRLAVAS